MDIKTAAVSYALAIPPYHPGMPIQAVAREFDLDPAQIVKLASNENPRGMSADARREMLQASDEAARYPDPDCYELRGALATELGVSADQILIGAGLSEILGLIARGFLTAGRAAVVPQNAFGVYDTATRSVGARSIVVKARDYGHDLDAMLAAIDETVGVVYVASPNNPTGTVLSAEALRRFVEAVPANILIVLDEAYREYLASEQRPESIAWLSHHANIVVLRTFSKAYGLAGLRVGYAVAAPAVIDILQRLRSPFSVSVIAQRTALAALKDKAFVDESYRLNAVGLKAMCRALTEQGVPFVPSGANFVLIQVGDGAKVFRALLRQGVIVRPMGSWGLPDSIRVTIGSAEENARFLAALFRELDV